MNEGNAEKLKKIFIPIGVFISALLILCGVFYLGSILKADVYFNVANELFKTQSYAAHKNIEIRRGGKIFHSYPYFCNAVFQAQEDGKDYYVIFVRMYGKYGPYQGLFLYGRQTGAEFCGLAGIQDPNKNASFYGIGNLVIEKWKKKIEKSFSVLNREGS